jgi:pimeloyl-ACP methyl ester carboxylesterase/extradiol dioxygenase family protein
MQRLEAWITKNRRNSLSKVYALLVGINAYTAPVRPLRGCLNDVDHLHDWLLRNVGGQHLAAQVLKDADATRANVIQQFRQHLGRAQAGDVVLFHYAGHGMRAHSAPEFSEFDPSGVDECLVLYDSMPKGLLLADKELAVLIGEVAQRDVHVTFVLDACHSGSITRSVDAFSGFQSRMVPSDDTAAPSMLDSYLDGHYTQRLKRGESLRTAPGRHMLLAACARDQEAKESPKDQRGVFSATLMDVLESTGGKLSYADLFVRCRAAVRKRAVDQEPQFEAIGRFDAWSGFLGGAAGSRSLRHSVFFDDKAKAWKVDAGAIHGLDDAGDRPVGLALYDEADLSQVASTAHAVEVGAQESTVVFDDAAAPAAETRFRAAITSLPTPPLLVHCAAEPALRTVWQVALDGDGAPLAASGVLLTEATEGVSYALVADGGVLKLQQRASGEDLLTEPLNPADPAAAAKRLLYALRSVAQWERLLSLQNRGTQIDPATIDFVCAEPTEDGTEYLHPGQTATLESAFVAGEWSEIKAKLKVRNRSGQMLYMALAHFAPDFGITVLPTDPLPSSENWVTLYGDADDDCFRLEEGCEQEASMDRFKLILSSTPIDGFQLAQPGLGQLHRAMGSRRKKARANDWLTKDLLIRVMPRVDAVSEQAWVSADGAIKVKGHRSLRAQLNQSSARPHTRAAGEVLPFVDAFERAGLSLPSFGNTRSTGDRSVVELTNIQNADSLRDEPLQIEIHQPLGPDEALVSFTFDGEHVLPCGEVTREADGLTLVTISELPPAAPSDRRSLGSALKLYFFKVYLKNNDVNRLRWVDYKADGSWAYREDDVAGKVAAAKRVLLLVHGIIGDTEGMAAGAREMGLDQQFDLVLTYDYENLSTPIAETARTLQRQLADAGLRAGDDKHLTLLVHSMGGLVSRWFIEREGGKDVVDHLVMCGTPNFGSPFGKVDDARKLLSVLAGLAANYMPAFLPFTAPVLMLLNRSQKLTPTLTQMNPDSDFIRELNASEDPGVRYSIVAGNVAEYREPTDELFAKLLTKAGQSFVFDALFAMKANDIAASVDSINRVGQARAPLPAVQTVACHHLNYFVSAAGQQVLKGIAW